MAPGVLRPSQPCHGPPPTRHLTRAACIPLIGSTCREDEHEHFAAARRARQTTLLRIMARSLEFMHTLR